MLRFSPFLLKVCLFVLLLLRISIVLILVPALGETYRGPVKDILMGRGAAATPRAKFHTAQDVAVLFEGRSAPELFAKSAWWHFAGVTVAGGEEELLRVYDRLLVMMQDLRIPDFPVVESRPEPLDAELLEDIARLWPPLVGNV